MTSRRRLPRIVCITAAATAIAVTAAGCSDDPKREYAVPKALCGVSVPEKSLSPLLPPGKDLTTQEDTPVPDAITTCKLTVDGDQVLTIERERREAGASARDIAVNQISVKQPKTAANRTIVYAGYSTIAISRDVVFRRRPPSSVTVTMSSMRTPKRPGR